MNTPDIADGLSTYPQAGLKTRISPMNLPDIVDEKHRISPMPFTGYRRYKPR